MKKTHSIGDGNVNLSTTVPQWLADEIVRLQQESGLKSRNQYVRGLLETAVKNHWLVHEKTETHYNIETSKK